MCNPAAALTLAGAGLSARENKRTAQRANDAALQRQQQNMLLDHNSRTHQAMLENDARRREAAQAMEALNAQSRGNIAAGETINNALGDFSPDTIKSNVQDGTAAFADRVAESASEEGAQERRAVQSGVEGNISGALVTRGGENQSALEENTGRLSSIYGGLDALKKSSFGQGVNLADLTTQLRQTYSKAEEDKRAAQLKGYIDGQVKPYSPPMLDNSPIEVKGSSGLGDLLQLAGTSLPMFSGTNPPSFGNNGFTSIPRVRY